MTCHEHHHFHDERKPNAIAPAFFCVAAVLLVLVPLLFSFCAPKHAYARGVLAIVPARSEPVYLAGTRTDGPPSGAVSGESPRTRNVETSFARTVRWLARTVLGDVRREPEENRTASARGGMRERAETAVSAEEGAAAFHRADSKAGFAALFRLATELPGRRTSPTTSVVKGKAGHARGPDSRPGLRLGVLPLQSPRPSDVPSRGLDFVEALRPANDACVRREGSCQMLFEASDVAEAMTSIGSPCRTPAAVRARVRVGLMQPDERTPRGSLWSATALEQELARERWAMRQARALGIRNGDTSIYWQRRANRLPVQLSILEVG